MELTKQLQREETILVFNVQQLGMEATARTFDLRAESYLRKISLNYYEIQGNFVNRLSSYKNVLLDRGEKE